MTDNEPKPVFMLNALWFKARGGAQRYQQYLAAAKRVIDDLSIGARTHTLLTPEAMLIGEWDPDLLFVVEYPDKAAFDRLVNSEQYQAIRHLREEALEKSLLIQCSRFVPA